MYKFVSVALYKKPSRFLACNPDASGKPGFFENLTCSFDVDNKLYTTFGF